MKNRKRESCRSESDDDKCTCGSFPSGCNEIVGICFRKKQYTVQGRGFYRNTAGRMKGYAALEPYAVANNGPACSFSY